MKIIWLKLDKLFDAAKMQEEIALLETGWTSHYNNSMYKGEWTVLPLYSINGSGENIISVHSSANKNISYSATGFLKECRYLQSVIDYFQCDKTAVRLMKLAPGAIIKEHSDHELSFEDGEARLHIPVITNEEVYFMLDGERVIMKEGECWYLDLSLKHSVENRSQRSRIHLVIDLKVNDWLKELFAGANLLKSEMEKIKVPSYNLREQLMIIEQLRILNTETSLALADKMEKELL